MRIASLAITNFRGVKSGHILFRKHTVLVGANNTGNPPLTRLPPEELCPKSSR